MLVSRRRRAERRRQGSGSSRAARRMAIMDGLGASETGPAGARRSPAPAPRPPPAPSRPGPGMCIVTEDLTRVLEPGDDEHRLAGPAGPRPARLPRRRRPRPRAPSRSSTACATRCPATGPASAPTACSSCYGRDSVTINSGGEKIFAEEVEAALAHHPAVYDVVVGGRPSERWGNEVVAVVQLRDGRRRRPTTSSLAEARRTSPATSCRRRSCFVDHIVRSPAGKADYRWARQA